MKRAIYTLMLMVLPLVLLTGCQEKSRPETTAQAWLNAFYNQDYSAARELSTDATLAKLAAQPGPKLPVGQIAKRISVTIQSVQVKGNEATVAYTFPEALAGSVPPVKLVKLNNKWLVQL